ncbi:MAG: hypothetical protein A2275_05890 [Bacteroidetes bacterium RIFOXYA12_FULL_35_11]|nr:MAG: hypothetical protein A2X01_00190 [Bacteroidetes bacterium GWF2_35_48]OFY78882.1 MAG: hypothetical protein A2275_05890 [Bacteroidetes bacterium RIFOXYA12_FULL_35_11]
MNMFKTYLEKIDRLNLLIRRRATGNPKQLAEKLDMSERRLYQCIDFLRKELKAPIKYNEIIQTYYYSEKGEIKLRWEDFEPPKDLKNNK